MKTAADLRAFCEGFNEAAVEQRTRGCLLAYNPYLPLDPCRKAWALGATAFKLSQTMGEDDDSEDDEEDWYNPEADNRHELDRELDGED